MELIHRTHKASKFAQEDFISNMPDNVITNILDRLPLQDAVRTDVLSKNWRFKWTMLSQLVFDDNLLSCLSKTKAENNQVRIVISNVLLQLRGSITKLFALTLDQLFDVEDEDISHWILFLSRKGIKDFTLVNRDKRPLKLSTHSLSCLELKHLKLYNCCFHPTPGFHSNILSLDLYSRFEESSDFWEFITRCPLLESLTLDYNLSKVKVVEISKLENLKILSLYLRDLNTTNNFHSSSTTFELLGSLPKLHELELNFEDCMLTEEGGATQRLSTPFPSLKVLKLWRICLDDDMKLSCAFELIRSCPNLQTLEISTCYRHAGQSPQEDYYTTGQLQLRSVRFEYLKGSESELCLLKYLLSCSPFLKRLLFIPTVLLRRMKS